MEVSSCAHKRVIATHASAFKTTTSDVQAEPCASTHVWMHPHTFVVASTQAPTSNAEAPHAHVWTHPHTFVVTSTQAPTKDVK